MIKTIATVLGMFLLCMPTTVTAQNSTKKIRVVPNAISAKIGTAIEWQSDFEEARRISAETKKPIFWYVPRLANTFMDRKKEVDRYMRAGPFSDPSIIASVNENYVPLMAIPKKAEAEAYELQPFKFIEPGFLVVETDGSASTTLDRITTMNSKWLASFLKPTTRLPEAGEALKRARRLFAAGEYGKCRAINRMRHSEDDMVELQLIAAMATFRSNEHESALQQFAAIGEAFPNHPLGWKAAAEAQRIGPFVRGFEVFRELPDETYLNAGRKSKGSAAPANTFAEEQLWRRGIEFLLSMQNEEGAFNDSDYDFGGTDSLPNVHSAVTSIAAMALLEAHGRPELKDLQPRIENAIKSAAAYVSDESKLNLQDKDEIFWAYLYRLRLFNRLQSKWQTGAEGITESLKALASVQTAGGDFYHEYNNPFVTASALWAMKESESLGAQVDASCVEAAIAALTKCRFANGAWMYSSPRNGSAAGKEASERRTIGSAGRMPHCEGALVIWDRADHDGLVESLESAFEMHDDMDRARKYDDHTSSYNYGGFFYWYCMETRTDAILKVTDEATQKEMAIKQRDMVMAVPEIDGCFVDSHEIGRSYGTAMALLCLAGCEQVLEEGVIR
ncbi:prenyltransferase/squalene oxidase repeat-containing protein [Mariniblastus fucicola]|uniref:Squalene cyclase C-terminal domain-containing protein n=1 Tax=Mariniblastus fucicola TaxID=980251 RepID=A0A5B9PEG7_9BACT|nr:hypothetical protein [Mariniblastus fucicola]QEG21353.1 hypothetical protein MFFC18_12090 [Mariniblastus fucicola]